jgi:hypothetical protein
VLLFHPVTIEDGNVDMFKLPGGEIGVKHPILAGQAQFDAFSRYYPHSSGLPGWGMIR